MEITDKFFDKVPVLKTRSRVDDRGRMTVTYEDDFFDNDETGFKVKETRIYTMPEKGTFFGIHYREEKDPMTKLVSVIKGRGMDYIVDLRKDSPTYLKWKSIELSAENGIAVLVPAGFGHGFLSLEDDTIQYYSVDTCGSNAFSKSVNYLDEKIGLKLEIPVIHIADYDINAPFTE